MREELALADENVEEKDETMAIIQGISSDYDGFIQCLTVNVDKMETLKLDKVKNAVLREEKRRQERGKNGRSNDRAESDQVFFTNKDRDNKTDRCSGCKIKGHTASECRYKNNTCYSCNRLGHLANHCPSGNKKWKEKNKNPRRNDNKLKGNDNQPQANLVKQVSVQPDFVFHIANERIVEIWLFDSGATNHTCCKRELFVSIRPYQDEIKMGDGTPAAVTAIGEIWLETLVNGKPKKISIKDVFFVK